MFYLTLLYNVGKQGLLKRTLAAHPPTMENTSFTFSASLSSLRNQALCSVEPRMLSISRTVAPWDINRKFQQGLPIFLTRTIWAICANSHSQIPILVGTVWPCFLYISPFIRIYCDYSPCAHFMFPVLCLLFFSGLCLGLQT